MIKLLRYATLVVILLALPFAGCKKGGSGNDDDEQELVFLNAGTMGFSPNEVVQVKIEKASLSNREINTTVGGKPIKIAIIDNMVHFIMPDLAEGAYQVKFKAERDFEFQVFVRKADAVNTPEEYKKVFKAGFDNIIAGIETRKLDASISNTDKAALEADRQRYVALFNEYETAYAKLDAEEKLAFARTMAANYQWVNSFAQTMQSTTGKAVQSLAAMPAPTASFSIEDYELAQNYAINKWLGSSRLLRDNVIKLGAMIALMPVTGAIPIIGTIGTGIALGYLVMEVASALAVNMADLRALMDVTFAPFQDITVDAAASDIYDSAEERVIDVQGNFRTLLDTDLSGTEINGNLKTFLNGLVEFRLMVSDLLTKMPARFKPSVVLASLRTSAASVKRNVNGAYLTISNITNAQVKVLYTKLTDGNFKITPSVTGTTDQQVSFDVTYSNPNFSNKQIKKTITTTIKYAIDSTAHYRQLVLGSWGVTNTESGDSYNLLVEAGGTAKYSVPGQQGTYNATWQVSKIGKKYYFREFGFWHPGYNQFRVFEKGFKDEGLRTPLTGFVHYNDLGGGKGPGAAIRYVKK